MLHCTHVGYWCRTSSPTKELPSLKVTNEWCCSSFGLFWHLVQVQTIIHLMEPLLTDPDKHIPRRKIHSVPALSESTCPCSVRFISYCNAQLGCRAFLLSFVFFISRRHYNIVFLYMSTGASHHKPLNWFCAVLVLHCLYSLNIAAFL